MKKTTEQIDKELLELARQMVPLMEAKGFKIGAAEYGLDSFSVNLWDCSDGIGLDISAMVQPVETIREKL